MLHRILLITAFASLPWAVACTQSEDDACGEGTVYRDGGCHVASAGTNTGTSGTTSSGDGGAGANAGGAPATGATDPNFGLDCKTADDCAGDTNYCVPMSPFDSAYCSVQDCDPSDPEVCPAGWTCTDLNRFQAGEPWACTRPY
jgi:hypothetical protein